MKISIKTRISLKGLNGVKRIFSRKIYTIENISFEHDSTIRAH